MRVTVVTDAVAVIKPHLIPLDGKVTTRVTLP